MSKVKLLDYFEAYTSFNMVLIVIFGVIKTEKHSADVKEQGSH